MFCLSWPLCKVKRIVSGEISVKNQHSLIPAVVLLKATQPQNIPINVE